jgi:hypothetical protein
MADDLYQHPVVIGNETTDLQESAISRIGDAFTRGVPAAAISGTLSIANTFLDYGRFFGITQAADYSIEEAVRSYDESAGDYYMQNKSAVDIGGFIGTSLIGGGLGVKALQIARGGNAMGAMGRALNFASSRRDAALAQALRETAENGGAIRGLLSSAARRNQLGWEVADQALLGLAAETVVLATMNDSPVFDGDTFKDFSWNMGLGVLLSGAIGGPLGSLGARGILKDAQAVIQKEMRAADTVFAHDNLGLTKGTELLGFAESITKLQTGADTIPFSYRTGAGAQSIELPVGESLIAARQKATKVAEEKLAIEFTRLAEGNAEVGQAYYDFIKRGSQAAKEAGYSPDEVISLIAGYLQNVSKVSHIDEAALYKDSRKFYTTLHPTANSTDPVEIWSGGAFTSKPGQSSSNRAYSINEGVEASDLVIKNLDELPELTIKDAFRKNSDIDILRMPDGSMRVNPRSPNITTTKENPFLVRKFMDLETGTIMPETVVTFGDMITKTGVQHGDDFITAGRRSFSQNASEVFDLTRPVNEASARWAWASKLGIAEIRRITGDVIDLTDLPLMQRLAELEGSISPDTLSKIRFKIGDQTSALDEMGTSLQSLLEETRHGVLQDALGKWEVDVLGAVPDTRAIAAHLNTSVEWVEGAIQRNFAMPGPGKAATGEVFSTANALKPKTVQVEWDLRPADGKLLPEAAYNMNMGPQNLAIKELSKVYQMEIRSRVNKTAAAAALGEDYNLLPDLDNLSQFSSIEGAGAGLAGASNAGYGEKAKLAVQYMGAQVARIAQKNRDEAVLALAADSNAIRMNQAAVVEFGVVTNALRRNPSQFIFDDLNPGLLISKEVAAMAKARNISTMEAISELSGLSKHPVHYQIMNSEVANFLRNSSRMNAARQDKFGVLRRATGLAAGAVDSPVVYAPPIDTVRYPYHAFVRTKSQIGVGSDVTMITAKSEEQLRMLAGKVDKDKFDVLFKSDTDNYFKAKGQYDYAETLNEARVNSELARTGVLSDMFTETRFENVMTDWLRFHAYQEEKLVREAVQVGNRQFFSEMQFLSETYRQEAESVTRGIGSKFKKAVADPFGDYIKTALNISKQQEVPLLDSLNEFVDKLGLKAGEAYEKAFAAARMEKDPGKRQLAYEEVNEISKRYGLGAPFKDYETYVAANERYPRNLIRAGIQKANAALATVTLRLDFANSLLNMISTPIMLGTEMQSIKGLIGKNSELAGKLAELTSEAVPGQGFRVPSTTRLTIGSVSDFFGPEKDALLSRYRDIGAIKGIGQKYHEMLDELSFDPALGVDKWMARIDAGVEKAATITGNNFSEEFTRFVSARVMDKLTQPLVDAGRMTAREQDMYISTFVNRVQGNYVTSQRPLIFQGTTGGAISLFQTYAFNVLQQLHRHMQAGDKKTLAVFGGLQSTIFGFNGLPFFDAINTHIIGSAISNNPEHKDLYSVLPKFNKEVGDWMLYGTASAFPLFSGASPALYTRGDINPRHITVIPTSPVDVPIVQAASRLATTVFNMGKNAAGGADLSQAMLQGLEHQGLNRPLAGLAQVMNGQSTTSKGTLISAASELETTTFLGALKNRVVDYGGVSRVLGARPMDEAVALNQMYRNKTYDALDKSRIERLGTIVKSKLYNNEAPTAEEMEEFMFRYTRSGGRIESFSQFMQRAYRDANQSVVNQTMQKVNSSTGRKLMDLMGGEMLPDYRNQLDGFSD